MQEFPVANLNVIGTGANIGRLDVPAVHEVMGFSEVMGFLCLG